MYRIIYTATLREIHKYVKLQKFLQKFVLSTTRQLGLSSAKLKTTSRAASTSNIGKQFVIKTAEEEATTFGKKVTIFGIGHVGTAVATLLLANRITSELCLIDTDSSKAMGEQLDFQHASIFLDNPHITAGNDIAASKGSQVCIVAASGKNRKIGSRHLELEGNVEAYKSFIPQLVKCNPKAIFVIISNPVDVMTYVTWKLSGLPISRVIGSGTVLDTARFRFFLSKRLGVSSKSCDGYIIGEHGDTSVPLWNTVTFSGMNLRRLNPMLGTKDDPDKWGKLHKDVVEAATVVRKFKGYTSTAEALCVCAIVQSILQNSNHVMTVSTLAQGKYGIEEDVCLSLPCVLNSSGVSSVVQICLTPEESEQLHNSAKYIAKSQSDVKL